jgi:hypothetical protein
LQEGGITRRRITIRVVEGLRRRRRDRKACGLAGQRPIRKAPLIAPKFGLIMDPLPTGFGKR